MNTKSTHQMIGRIIEVIRSKREFLLLTHVSPDGDAVGSLLALGRVLAGMGKKCHLLSPGEIPPEYHFLKSPGEISRSLPEQERWEVVFLLDTPCLSRLPQSLSGEIPACGQLVNIDHHASNTIDGDLNWIDGDASSVGEMLYWLFDKGGYPISPGVAAALYTAVLTDTGSFRFPNTTPFSLKVAASLLEHGADAAYIAGHVYASHSLQKYRLLGEALTTLRTCCSGRAAFMCVTTEMLENVGASSVETDGFVNFAGKLKGIEVAILFRQEPDGERVKVSLRSRTKTVDVARVAAKFQGGGHPTAAGCTIAGSMEHAQKQVLEAVGEELARVNAIAGPSASKEIPPEE